MLNLHINKGDWAPHFASKLLKEPLMETMGSLKAFIEMGECVLQETFVKIGNIDGVPSETRGAGMSNFRHSELLAIWVMERLGIVQVKDERVRIIIEQQPPRRPRELREGR